MVQKYVPEQHEQDDAAGTSRPMKEGIKVGAKEIVDCGGGAPRAVRC